MQRERDLLFQISHNKSLCHNPPLFFRNAVRFRPEFGPKRYGYPVQESAMVRNVNKINGDELRDRQKFGPGGSDGAIKRFDPKAGNGR